MIINARESQKIVNASCAAYSSCLPSVNDGVMKNARPILFIINETSNVNGKQEIIPREIKTRGTAQPTKAQDVALYPEGTRAWRWMTFHVGYGNLSVNDGFKWNGVTFKVMGKDDFSDYGYFKFDCVENYV